MPTRAVTAAFVGSLVVGIVSGRLTAQAPRGGDCVKIGTPKASVGYSYERRDSSGTVSRYTHYWEEITVNGSRLRTVLGPKVVVQVNRHHIDDDVSVIDSTSSTESGGGAKNTTTFQPGVVGDPAFRACAGRSWTIRAATARHVSAQGNASAQTFSGTLAIVALREPVSVPAGTFDTVRYLRTLSTPVGKSVDEYWKSLEHGVVVKHTSKLPGGASTELLQAIR
jgi:hypothetical protein